MVDLDECPRCGLGVDWRGDASGRCVKCYWPDGAQPDPRDAEIARLKAEVERLTAIARLLVSECEEQRECPVCGTDTNVEVCRPSCYVAKMRKVLDDKTGGEVTMRERAQKAEADLAARPRATIVCGVRTKPRLSGFRLLPIHAREGCHL